ncbi:single-stranded DNA-binding protein [Lysinibacillus sp. MHQ-1]|nr:single-stranded DNA-binding protein [Lysinibacillus sp. MHQ-1]
MCRLIFSLAINRNFKNNHGEIDTDFIFCTVWGRLAEHIVKYCGKGSLIGANGRIQTRSFVNEENTKIFYDRGSGRGCSILST